MCFMNKFSAGKGFFYLKFCLLFGKVAVIITDAFYISVCRNHKPKCSAGRVVAAFTNLRGNQLSHYID